MRAPDFGVPPVDLYQAAVEQCAWADRLGFDSVALLEHHASVDGYLPSPIVLGSAVAAVTERMLIRMSVVLLPLYHPIRLAEDLAVLDLISQGRLRLTVGAGYRPEEYEQFDLNIKRRPSLMEDGVEVLKQAWSGEPFEWRGHTVRVLPRPAQEPRPSIRVGRFVARRRQARRAYRRRLPARGPAPVRRVPRGARRARQAGTRTAPGPSGRRRHVLPHRRGPGPRMWSQIAPHAMHETNDYAAWAVGIRGSPYKSFDTADELRESGMYEIVTPDAAVELIRERGGANFKPLMGGLDPDLGWESLHLFESDVLPRLRS